MQRDNCVVCGWIELKYCIDSQSTNCFKLFRRDTGNKKRKSKAGKFPIDFHLPINQIALLYDTFPSLSFISMYRLNNSNHPSIQWPDANLTQFVQSITTQVAAIKTQIQLSGKYTWIKQQFANKFDPPNGL